LLYIVIHLQTKTLQKKSIFIFIIYTIEEIYTIIYHNIILYIAHETYAITRNMHILSFNLELYSSQYIAHILFITTHTEIH